MLNIKQIHLFSKESSFKAPNVPAIFFINAPVENGPPRLEIDQKKIAQPENSYVVTLKITVKATKKDIEAYELVFSQSGLFQIIPKEGQDIKPGELERALSIDCLNLLFPYARAAMSQMTLMAGFPPLMLQIIDFRGVYAQQRKQVVARALIQRQQQAVAAGASAAADDAEISDDDFQDPAFEPSAVPAAGVGSGSLAP